MASKKLDVNKDKNHGLPIKLKVSVDQEKLSTSFTLYQCCKSKNQIASYAKNFLKKSYKGNIVSFHPSRIQEVYLSQYLIYMACHKKVAFEKIKLKNWQEIVGFKSRKVSLTHNKMRVLLLSYDPSIYQACGIDEEEKARPITAQSARLFINAQDQFDRRLSLLSKWVIKESCFKAVSVLDSSLKSLKQIQIGPKNTFVYQDIEGFFKRLNTKDQFICYMAWIKS